MERKLCPSCGKSDMKLIPAGVSKTKIDAKTGQYKKYSAFWSCPDCRYAESYSEVNTHDLMLADRVSGCEEDIKKIKEFIGI